MQAELENYKSNEVNLNVSEDISILYIVQHELLNQKEVDIEGKTIEVYLSLSKLTTVFDITGLPALNIPAGLVDSKLPVGVQLVGRPFDEARILQIAYSYEQHYSLGEQFIPPAIT